MVTPMLSVVDQALLYTEFLAYEGDLPQSNLDQLTRTFYIQ